MGDGTDSFTLAISADNPDVVSWYSLETRTVANLEAGGVRIVRLSVSVPKGALVDQETAITVSATSQFDTSKRAEVPVNTAVKAMPKLQLVFVSFPTEAQAGSSIEVTVRVQNLGNADARIQFNPGNGDSGWLTIKTVLPQTVKPLKSLDLEFTLTIPAGTAAGSHTVSVSVKDLKGNVNETKSIQLNVKGGGGFIPALTTPALMLGLVAVAALLLHGAGPRRRP
jgi:uncharacterized membrane protein